MVVEVTCAIIEKDGKVFAVQRGEHMSLAYKWEFPGGKVEPEETHWECLVRELREELEIDIDVWEKLPFSDQAYPERIIRLIPFICTIKEGQEINLTEHNAMAWLEPENLTSLDWAPADLKVIENYLKFSAEKVR